MKSITLAVSSTALILMFTGTTSFAADQEQTQTQTQTQTQSKTQAKQQIQAQVSDNDPVYGWELMSVKERKAHRAKMQKLKTPQARTAYLEQHHKLMEKRAKERGVNLPDRPMMGKQGMRSGAGLGAGAGPGAGAGAGGGPRSR